MRPVTVTVTSPSSLSLLYLLFYGEAPQRAKGTTIRPKCWHQTVSFFLRIPLSSDGVDSFLPTRKPNYNHSATKGLKPCSIPCKALDFLIAVVQPSRSESFTMRRAYVYPINRHWVPARASYSASCQDTQNTWLVHIKPQETSLLMLLLDVTGWMTVSWWCFITCFLRCEPQLMT